MALKRKTIGILVVVAVAWVAFFYSGRAVLVWQWTDEDDHRLTCNYVAASSVFERKHLYTESGLLGRTVCPRIVKLDR